MRTQVSEQEVLWSSLKGDVEALLLQAPTVALDALAHQLSAHQAAVTEQVGAAAAGTHHTDLKIMIYHHKLFYLWRQKPSLHAKCCSGVTSNLAY